MALRTTGSIQPEARASGSIQPEARASGSAQPEDHASGPVDPQACASGLVDPEARTSVSPGFVSRAPVSPQLSPRISGPHCSSPSVVAQRSSRASAPSSSENGPAQQSPGASRSAVPFSPVLGRDSASPHPAACVSGTCVPGSPSADSPVLSPSALPDLVHPGFDSALSRGLDSLVLHDLGSVSAPVVPQSNVRTPAPARVPMPVPAAPAAGLRTIACRSPSVICTWQLASDIVKRLLLPHALLAPVPICRAREPRSRCCWQTRVVLATRSFSGSDIGPQHLS